jgi:hypothetical protein
LGLDYNSGQKVTPVKNAEQMVFVIVVLLCV